MLILIEDRKCVLSISIRQVVIIFDPAEDLLPTSVNDNAFCKLAFRDSIPCSTKVENLGGNNISINHWNPSLERTYFDISQTITLHRGNTPPVIELDLPHATKVCEEVSNTLAVSHIPHLQRPVRPGDDLLSIVLEAGDGTGVCAQGVLAVAMHGVPDSEGGISSSRDKEIVLQSEQANERRMAFKII